MADTNPPDEIDDRKAPPNRDVDAPNSDALRQQQADRQVQKHQEAKRDCQARSPARPVPSTQDNRAYFVGDAFEGMAGLNN